MLSPLHILWSTSHQQEPLQRTYCTSYDGSSGHWWTLRTSSDDRGHPIHQLRTSSEVLTAASHQQRLLFGSIRWATTTIYCHKSGYWATYCHISQYPLSNSDLNTTFCSTRSTDSLNLGLSHIFQRKIEIWSNIDLKSTLNSILGFFTVLLFGTQPSIERPFSTDNSAVGRLLRFCEAKLVLAHSFLIACARAWGRPLTLFLNFLEKNLEIKSKGGSPSKLGLVFILQDWMRWACSSKTGLKDEN